MQTIVSVEIGITLLQKTTVCSNYLFQIEYEAHMKTRLSKARLTYTGSNFPQAVQRAGHFIVRTFYRVTLWSAPLQGHFIVRTSNENICFRLASFWRYSEKMHLNLNEPRSGNVGMIV